MSDARLLGGADLPGRVAVPPVLLVVVAIVAFQASAVISEPVIEEVGALGAIGPRTAIGAALLLAWRRPSPRLGGTTWRLLLATGLAMAATNALIYAAIDHVPVGVAVAVQFAGPIAVALAGSRRAVDLLWVALAAVGIVLFTPLADASFAPRGVVFALLSGAAFGLYLVLTARLSRRLPNGVTLMVTVAAAVLLPLGLADAGAALWDAEVLLRCVVAAVLSNLVGFSLEFSALGRVRASVYAVVICLEPAVASVLAVVILDERLSLVSTVAIALVTVAALGASRGKGATA